MSYGVSDFPNLQSSIWDTIRVPVRGPIKRIANQMCADEGFDPDMVRNIYLSRKLTPKGLVELRCRIVATLVAAGFALFEIQYQFFTGFKTTTLQDYLYDGRKLLKEAEDA